MHSKKVLKDLKRIILTLVVLMGVVGASYSQSNCFQIESVLVDACGSNEGTNEMVRIRIGANDLSTSDINITWPNNPYRGICQNTATANKVAQMNATILSCGYFVEPVGGVLPANSEVLIITSTDFDPSTHDYSGMQDTIIVIFQCSGNTAGHFANYNSSCSTRTLSVTFGATCMESVTYDRCLLVNQNGEVGGSSALRDGARVDFDAAGTATYANDGCTIPYVPVSVAANFVNGDGTICPGGSVDISALVNGNASQMSWSSSQGSFANPTNLQTSYTPNGGVTTSHYIYFSAENNCNEPEIDSLLITFDDLPDVTINANATDACEPGEIQLTVSGADMYLWSTGETTTTITPTTSGTYTVTGSNSCGADQASITVNFGTVPSCSITNGPSDVICSGESVNLIGNSASSNVSWSTGETTSSIAVTEAGWYYFTVTEDCGVCRDSIEISVVETTAFFTATPNEGIIPFDAILENQSTDYDMLSWSVDGTVAHQNEEVITLPVDMPGVYEVVLTATNTVYGCTDSYTVTIMGYENNETHIPNVFTPNGDGLNDYFGITTSAAVTVDIRLFNRWGNSIVVREYESVPDVFEPIWDGTMSNGSTAGEGVYFYRVTITPMNGDVEEFHGNFQLTGLVK